MRARPKSKTPLLPAVFLFSIASLLPAQDVLHTHSQGYVYAASMFSTDGGLLTRPQVGAGGDYALSDRVSVGGDLGWLISQQEGFGIASVNGSYHPVSFRDGKLVPFVTGGYSAGFRDSALSLVNFGGGFNYWFQRRSGFRFEARHHLRPGGTGLLTLRFGVSFR